MCVKFKVDLMIDDVQGSAFEVFLIMFLLEKNMLISTITREKSVKRTSGLKLSLLVVWVYNWFSSLLCVNKSKTI